MKAILILSAVLSLGLIQSLALAEDNHAKHEEQHDEHEEERSNAGPNKGITAADEHDGIKLSPEAVKKFEIKVITLSGSFPWDIPVTALLTSREENNIYRVRNGFYKRIDFNLISKTTTHMKVTSNDLAKGDGVVISGVGFLRTAELTAFSAPSEGHGH